MISDVEHLFMSFGHLYVLLGEVSIQVLCPFFNLIAALFIIPKKWQQPKCPSIDEQIKQLWDIYITELYLAVKKKKILPFATVKGKMENIMDGPGEHYAK